MPLRTEEGLVASYDSATQSGTYTPSGASTDKTFETVRPITDIRPGKAITIMVETPSGRQVAIAIKFDGRDI